MKSIYRNESCFLERDQEEGATKTQDTFRADWELFFMLVSLLSVVLGLEPRASDMLGKSLALSYGPVPR